MSLVTKTWSKFGQFDYLMMKICFLNVSSTSFAFLFGQVISFAPENYFVAIKNFSVGAKHIFCSFPPLFYLLGLMRTGFFHKLPQAPFF